MKTKLFTLLLAVAASVGTMFASDTQVNGIWYDFDRSNKTAIVTYQGASYSAYNNEYTGSVVIPASVSYGGRTYSVTSIGKYAFRNCTGLTSVTIPNSVTSIEYGAFYYCESLTSVTIPNSVTSIGRFAFCGCSSLTSITIPNGVTSIGYSAFKGCSSLTSVTIPNSVTYIEPDAFYNCTGLTSVTIPNSVTSIGGSAFHNCTSIFSIDIPNSVTTIADKAFSGVLHISYTGSATGSPWGAKMMNKYIDGDLIFNDPTKKTIIACNPSVVKITIPSNVESISSSAFSGCNNLKDINFNGTIEQWCNKSWSPVSVSSSYNLYIQNAKVTDLVIPNNNTSIRESAFSGCSSLTSVTIPNSVTSIGNSVFKGCSGLTSVTIPNSVMSISSSAFSGCNNLKDINFNGTIEQWCNKSWSPVSVSSSYNLYIQNAKVTDLVIPNNITSIGNSVFKGCTGMTSVTIPNSVTNIGETAFSGCSGLTSVTISNSVTSIGSYAFSGCSGLTSVTIPNSVTTIERSAFSGCSNLTSVTIHSNAAVNVTGTSEYDHGARIVYGTNQIFGLQVKSYIIGDGVTNIGASAFREATNLKSVTMTNTVKSIGSGAFSKCTGLTSVTIPNSVTSIGNSAFGGCTGLTSVTIPNSVTSIGDLAFGECNGLTSVTINSNAITSKNYTNVTNFSRIFGSQVKEYTLGNNVQKIGEYAFYKCTSMSSITIPQSITSIASNAFGLCIISTINYTGSIDNWCSKKWGPTSISSTYQLKIGGSLIKFLEIPSSVTNIAASAFQGCNSLVSITIPNSVNSIGNGAFANCPSLTSVAIPNSVKSIGGDAFNNSVALKTVYITDLSGWCKINFGNSNSNPLRYAPKLYLNNVLVEELVIPNDVTSIGNLLFSNWKGLKSLVIHRNISNIENNSFLGCSNLTSVTIESNAITSKNYTESSNIANIFGSQVKDYILGNSILKIGEYAFYGCSSWETVTFLSYSVPNLHTTLINQNNNHVLTYVPCGRKDAYDYAFSLHPDFHKFWIRYAPLKYKISAVVNNSEMGRVIVPETKCDNLIAEANEGYRFVQWNDGVTENPRYVELTKDTSFKAIFEPMQYTITFNANGGTIPTIGNMGNPPSGHITTLSTDRTSGTVVVTTKRGDFGNMANDCPARVGYTFAGWYTDPTSGVQVYDNTGYGMVGTYWNSKGKWIGTSDVTLYAHWTPILYLITFLDENGSVLKNEEVEYDAMPVAPVDPTKESTAQYDYTFAGWTPEVTIVTQAATYTATYTSTLREYLVMFLNEDNTVISCKNYKYGETPIAPADPIKPNTAEYTYTFNGWDNAIAQVQGPQTYKATFSATKNSYTITWQDENGSLIDQTTVEYGQIPAHAEPTKEATAEYTYTFAGWTPAVVAVTGNATYKATFTATKNSYTITWQNEDGSLIDQTTVEYGVVPTHAEPTKEATEEYTYTFADWNPAVVAVTGDATYTATFSSVVNVYTITVSAVNGQVIGGGEYQYGATIDLTAIPDEGYVFDQWSDGVTDNPRTITVTGDVEYTALFTSTEGFENIYTSEPVQKVIIDQKVYILRGEKVYTLQGQEVK